MDTFNAGLKSWSPNRTAAGAASLFYFEDVSQTVAQVMIGRWYNKLVSVDLQMAIRIV